MQNDCNKIVLFEIGGLATEQYKTITKKLDQLITQMSQLDDRVIAMNTRLDEASSEILALLGQLRDETLTQAGQDALSQAETKVAALADIVPGPTQKPAAG